MLSVTQWSLGEDRLSERTMNRTGGAIKYSKGMVYQHFRRESATYGTVWDAVISAAVADFLGQTQVSV